MILVKYKDILRSTDVGLLVLRLTVGGLMLFHGVSKAIGGVDGIAGMLEGMGLPGFIAYGALLCELVAPVMMVLGVWTRAASLALAVNMVVAILMAHAADIFALNPATGAWAIELPALYLFGAVALCFSGGGRLSLTRGTLLD